MLGLLLLMAAGGGTVTLSNQAIQDPAGTSAAVRFYPDGTWEGVTSVTLDPYGNWLEPPSLAPGGYQIRVTVLSGTLFDGDTDVWLDLTEERQWTVQGMSQSATIRIEIGIGGTPLGECTVIVET